MAKRGNLWEAEEEEEEEEEEKGEEEEEEEKGCCGGEGNTNNSIHLLCWSNMIASFVCSLVLGELKESVLEKVWVG